MDLPDVNLWLALSDPRHALHPAARHYWDELRGEAVAFCRVTMLGLLRLATNHNVMHGDPFTSQEIWEIYRTYRAMPIIHFLNESSEIENIFSPLSSAPHFANRLWTDAYLAAFAQSTSCRLVTFDADFSLFPLTNVLHLRKNLSTS